jgi:hypothetical protein
LRIAVNQEDFEAITAIHEIKHGYVRVELQYLGFCFIGRRSTGGKPVEARKVVTYAEACEVQFPIEVFRAAVAMVIADLDGARA